MLKLFVVLFFRNLRRNLRFQAVNIASFGFSLFLFFIVLLYVNTELGYNTGFTNYDRTFRVNTLVQSKAYSEQLGLTLSFVAPYLKESIADIQAAVRIHERKFVEVNVPASERDVLAKTVWTVDTTIFEVFDFKISSGASPDANFKDAYVSSGFSKVLLKDNGEVVGREIIVDEEVYIVKEIISNEFMTDLTFDIILCSDIKADWVSTFVKVNETSNNKSEVAHKMSTLLNEQLAGEYNEKAMSLSFVLESLEDLHFTKASFNSFRGVDKSLIQILFWSAIILIFSSAFNSVNLTVAGSLTRMKEISLKKIYGTKNIELLGQSAIEAFLTIFLGLVVAIITFAILGELVSDYLGLSISPNELMQGSSLLTFFTVTSLLIVISTVLNYYSFFGVINGSLFDRNTRSISRRFSSLVVVQLSICLFLLCVTFFVGQQIRLISDTNLAPSHDSSIVMRFPNSGGFYQHEDFKNQVMNSPSVYSASLCNSNSILGSQPDLDLFKLDREPDDKAFLAKKLTVDRDYFKTMNITLAVDNLRQQNWHNELVLTQTAKRVAGDSVVVRFDEMNNKHIAGVSDDFQWTSYKGVEPIVFLLDTARLDAIIVRFQTIPAKTDIEQVNWLWKSFFPNVPFEYEVLSEINARTYRNEFLLNKLLSLVSIVTYAISIIGILAISSMITVRRTKEFSIRRIFGASITSLASKVCISLGILFIVSMVLSLPLVYMMLDQWLERFSNKTEINFLTIIVIFILFALTSLLLNVSFVYKLLRTNPVNTLRNN